MVTGLAFAYVAFTLVFAAVFVVVVVAMIRSGRVTLGSGRHLPGEPPAGRADERHRRAGGDGGRGRPGRPGHVASGGDQPG